MLHYDNIDIVNALISANANVNYADRHGYTALYLGIKSLSKDLYLTLFHNLSMPS